MLIEYRVIKFSKLTLLQVTRSASSFAETTFTTVTEKTVDGFSSLAESVSKKIEGLCLIWIFF